MQGKTTTPRSFSRQIRDRLGDKWTVPVIEALAGGALRFGELWRQVGAAPKVLTDVLRGLERDGLIERSESRDAGLHVKYALSTSGRAFHQLVADIDIWAARHEPRFDAARRLYAPPTNRSAPAETSTPTAPAGMALSHICLPVRNIDQAMLGFARVLGADPSCVVESNTVLQPGRGRERIRICWFAFPNLLVELIQQVRGSGRFSDFLDGTGPGVAHIGVDVAPDWRVTPHLRNCIGPRLTERPDGLIHRADVDLNTELGTEIHLLSPLLRETAERWIPSPSSTAASLAAQSVSTIGVVVPDVMQADRACSTLRRIIDPSTRQPRRAFRYRQTEDAMIATCSDGGIAIDLIQPLRGPLHDYLTQHGPGVHHLGFDVGSGLEATVERLERKGAEPLSGSVGNGHVLLDLGRTMGLRIEVTSVR